MLKTKIWWMASVVEILLFTVGIAITLWVLVIIEWSYYQYKNINLFLESNKNIDIKYQLDSDNRVQFDRDDAIWSNEPPLPPGDGIKNASLHDDLDTFFSSMNTLWVDIELPPGYISQDIFNKNMYIIEFYNSNIRDIPNYEVLINSLRSNKYVVWLFSPTFSPLDINRNKFIVEFK